MSDLITPQLKTLLLLHTPLQVKANPSQGCMGPNINWGPPHYFPSFACYSVLCSLHSNPHGVLMSPEWARTLRHFVLAVPSFHSTVPDSLISYRPLTEAFTPSQRGPLTLLFQKCLSALNHSYILTYTACPVSCFTFLLSIDRQLT